jgi:hypothetical protein
VRLRGGECALPGLFGEAHWRLAEHRAESRACPPLPDIVHLAAQPHILKTTANPMAREVTHLLISRSIAMLT